VAKTASFQGAALKLQANAPIFITSMGCTIQRDAEFIFIQQQVQSV